MQASAKSSLDSITTDKGKRLPDDEHGTWKDVSFYKLRKSKLTLDYPGLPEHKDEKCVEGLDVVFLKPKKIDIARVASRAQRLLIDRQVHSPFLSDAIFNGSDGSKIELKADQSLWKFIQPFRGPLAPKLNKTTVLSIVGQMLLGVETLHDKNIAHCDIKPPNILISNRRGKEHIQFCDMDTIITVDPQTGRERTTKIDPITLLEVEEKPACWLGPAYWLSPEAFVLSIAIKKLMDEAKKFSHDKSKLSNLNHQMEILEASPLNRKAVDCYALGESIWKTRVKEVDGLRYAHHSVMDCLDPSDVQTVKDLQDLATRLKNPVLTRFTIKEAKNHQIFGATPEERESFFSSLIKEFSHEIYIDSYLVPKVLEQDDDFYIKPEVCKQIQLAETRFSLQKVKDCLDENHHYNNLVAKAVRNNITFFKEKIQERLQDPELRSSYRKLDRVKVKSLEIQDEENSRLVKLYNQPDTKSQIKI